MKGSGGPPRFLWSIVLNSLHSSSLIHNVVMHSQGMRIHPAVLLLSPCHIPEIWPTVQSASTLCFDWGKCRECLRLHLYQPAKWFSYSLTPSWKRGQEVKRTSKGEVLQQACGYWVHCIKSATPSLSIILWFIMHRSLWKLVRTTVVPRSTG